jgi:hypothetical protein
MDLGGSGGPATPATVAAMNAAQGVAAMTLVDVLITAMVNVRRAAGGKRQVLLASLRDLPLPKRPGDGMQRGAALEIAERLEERRVTRSGAQLTPVVYRFTSLQSSFSQAIAAETDLPYRSLLARLTV